MPRRSKTTDIGAPPAVKTVSKPTDEQKKALAVTTDAEAATKAAKDAQKVADKAVKDAEALVAKAAKDAAAAKEKAEKEAATQKIVKSLEPAARDIKASIEAANKSEDKAFDHRLSAAYKLGEVKKKLEGTNVSLKSWAEKNVADEKIAGLSYESLKVLVRVGTSEDPKAALEDLRNKNKKANKDLRDKKKGAKSSGGGKSPAKKGALQAVEETVSQWPDTAQVDLARKLARKSGMVVLSETAAKSVAAAGAKKPLDQFKVLWDDADGPTRLGIVNYIETKTGNQFASAEVVKAGYAAAKA